MTLHATKFKSYITIFIRLWYLSYGLRMVFYRSIQDQEIKCYISSLIDLVRAK